MMVEKKKAKNNIAIIFLKINDLQKFLMINEPHPVDRLQKVLSSWNTGSGFRQEARGLVF